MDANVWLGIAGISGTLAAGVLVPLTTERMRQKSARGEQILAHRLELYADLIRVTARVADNARTWSAVPLAELKETDDDELDRVLGRARALAGKDVYEHLGELTRCAQRFNRRLLDAKMYRHRLQREGTVDDGLSMKQRLDLGAIAEQIATSANQLEAVIRDELN